jgi:hypothetical protein
MKLVVVVPTLSLVDVAVEVLKSLGIASSRISIIFGGGKLVVVAVEGGSDFDTEVVEEIVGFGVVVAGLLVAIGVLGGTIIGSGREIVEVAAGVEEAAGVEVGAETGTVLVAGVTGISISRISVVSSVEVDAERSMYAELFCVKLPYGACGERSSDSELFGASQPCAETAFGNICACFVS